MRARKQKAALGLIAAIAIAAGLVMLGRLSVHSGPAPQRGSAAARSDDYFDGLRVGEAQGRQEGRAIQEGAQLPATSRQPVHDAFNDGYAAGTNDAFAGYDGGWALSVPYVVSLEGGSGKIAYRISTRTVVEPNVNYYLCPNGHDICQQARK
jgi:hypothetical protein